MREKILKLKRNNLNKRNLSDLKPNTQHTNMETVEAVAQPLRKFAKDSKHFINKCTKPDKKGKIHYTFATLFFFCSPYFYTEFTKIATGTAIGFLIMGFLGYFIKLIHIPINNILVGG